MGFLSAPLRGAPMLCEGRDLSDDTDDTIAETETLPLDAWHRRKGARMVPFAGYYMPIQFDGIVSEHNWTRSQAGQIGRAHV